MTSADLKAWRKSKGLRQSDIAACVEVSERTVRHWEHDYGDESRNIPAAALKLLILTYGK